MKTESLAGRFPKPFTCTLYLYLCLLKNKRDERRVYVCLREISASSFSRHDGEESQKPGQKRQEREEISSVETEMDALYFFHSASWCKC